MSEIEWGGGISQRPTTRAELKYYALGYLRIIQAESRMTTKFPQLPVLGHVPKKRKENLDKVLTLRQIYEILDSEWLADLIANGATDGDYCLQTLRQEFKAAVRRAPGVGEGK
jgi:hypothetical protein